MTPGGSTQYIIEKITDSWESHGQSQIPYVNPACFKSRTMLRAFFGA